MKLLIFAFILISTQVNGQILNTVYEPSYSDAKKLGVSKIHIAKETVSMRDGKPGRKFPASVLIYYFDTLGHDLYYVDFDNIRPGKIEEYGYCQFNEKDSIVDLIQHFDRSMNGRHYERMTTKYNYSEELITQLRVDSSRSKANGLVVDINERFIFYDSLNRILLDSSTTTGNFSFKEIRRFEYDEYGLNTKEIYQKTRNGATKTTIYFHEYDSLGRLVLTKRRFGDEVSVTEEFEYKDNYIIRYVKRGNKLEDVSSEWFLEGKLILLERKIRDEVVLRETYHYSPEGLLTEVNSQSNWAVSKSKLQYYY